MEKLEYTVRQTICRYHMLQPGDQVVIALSGGADSVCLLSLLADMREEMGLKLRSLHVHHGLRGEEADRDGDFSIKISEALGVPCHMIKAEVKKYASQTGMSEGENGQTVKIAVAHHSRDQAETILLNLFRGSGLGGLKGIPYVRDRIIRPMLDVSKEDIIPYLEKKRLKWVNDSSNDTDHYARNRVRSHILPAIKEEINPGAEAGIRRAGYLAGMADVYLKKQADQWVQKYVKEEEHTWMIPEGPFKEADPVIRLYSVMELLKTAAGCAKDLGLVHAEQVEKLVDLQTGRKVSLPYGLEARKVYGGISLRAVKKEPLEERIKNPLPELSFEVFSYEKAMEFPKKTYTKWFDCDKIKGTPVVRTRQTGDYITLENGSRKPLRRFMIDEKIPADKRDEIALLADGDHIMWIIGRRISSYYKIGPDTRRVLQAKVSQSTLS